MNWMDDPELESIQRLHRVRNGLIRTAFIWTPLFLAALGACIFYLIDTATGGQHGGTSVLVVVLAIAAFLFGFQSIQALLDLRNQPIEATGFIQRRWARRDSFVFQTQYVRMGKRILRGDSLLLLDIKEKDYVHVAFFPHSSVLVSIEKAEPPEGEEPPKDEPLRPGL